MSTEMMTMATTTTLYGSFNDLGYLKIEPYLNKTRVSLMLSSQTSEIQLFCEKIIETTCSCPIINNETNTLCFQHPTTNDDDNKYCFLPLCLSKLDNNNNALKETVEHGIFGISPINNLKLNYLTICFGNKKRLGRLGINILEPDQVMITPYIRYSGNFILSYNPQVTCPLRFFSPDDTFDVGEDKNNNNNMTTLTRLDVSSTYSWIPSNWFRMLRRNFLTACKSLGCVGYRDYSDGAALTCFRFSKEDVDENMLPDLEWRLIENSVHIIIPPSRYLFTTEDGSRCIGIFEDDNDSEAILGLNLLTGLRVRIDYGTSTFKIDSCISTSHLPVQEIIPGGFAPTSFSQDSSGGWALTLSPTIGGGGGGHNNNNNTDKSLSIIVIFGFSVGLLFGLFCAVRFYRNSTSSSTYFQKKSGFKMRANSFLKNNFTSRKQTFRTVTFKEDPESSSSSSSDDEEEEIVENVKEENDLEKQQLFDDDDDDDSKRLLQ